MLVSKVKVKYPSVFKAISIIASDNGGSVNLNATLPTNVVFRVYVALKRLNGIPLGGILPKGFNLNGIGNVRDSALVAFTVGDSLVINAIAKAIPDGVYVNTFFNNVFDGIYYKVIVYG